MERKSRRPCLAEIVASALQVVAIVSALAMAPVSRGAEPAAQLREGIQAFYKGEFERAASLAHSYVRLHPQNPAGLVLLARAEMAQGKNEPAYQDLRKALRLDPQNIDALYFLGQATKTLGQLEYERMFALAPDSARSHQFLAESYVAQRRDDKAAEEYKTALKADPRSVELLCALGDVERWLLRFDDAIEHYSRALELAPNEYCGYQGLGVAHLRRHELPSAIEYLRHAAVLQPQSGETRLALGSALLSSGDVTGALPELKAAVANKPDLRQAYALLARVYQKLGQPKEAEEALKRAKELEQREHEYVQKALILDDLSLAPSPDEK
jgi:tetratricopeptide (TPR) repeat protein